MSPMTRTLVAALATLALVGCPKDEDQQPTSLLHVPSPAWEDQIIYFVLTDRFDDGDTTNDDQGGDEFDPADAGKYSGGDLQGIIDRLDYIQGLGATAVWITPPVANMWWDPIAQFGGYHGYWARDLGMVDEHYGTLDTYKRLSEALHGRGMYLIQDVVPNHMGNFFTYGNDYDPACVADWTAPACDPTVGYVANTAAAPGGKPTRAPFDQNDPRIAADRAAAIYHWTPQITNYLDPYQEKHWQISDLDDLNTENPVVRKALKQAYGYWVKEVGVDGFRVDTAKFVPVDFWRDFFHSPDAEAPGILEVAKSTGRSDFIAFGEVFETSEAKSDAGEQKLAAYLGTPADPALPGVLQFPLYEEISRVFAGGRPTDDMAYRIGRFMDPALFPDPFTTPTFIDNHDVARFRSLGSERALAQALSFLFTLPGIPVVYQGTEQSYLETRQAMFKGGWAPGAPLGADQFDTFSSGYDRLKKLADLRKAHPALRRGDVAIVYSNVASAGALGYRRTSGDDKILVLLNTADKETLVADLSTGLAPGTVLEKLYQENMGSTPVPKVAQEGKILTRLPARAILIARATSSVVAPPAPAATITVSTPIQGQTFTTDVTVSGTVTPASTALQLVVDDDLANPIPITVAAGGSFSVVLPVSEFPDGPAKHTLTVHAPLAEAASPRYAFDTNVVFVGDTLVVDDPAGDDTGRGGTYTYPTDATYARQMDLVQVKAEVGASQLRLNLKMRDFSTSWNPKNGFDHVCFDIYFQIPGQTGLTVLPKLYASAPAGFSWSLQQFTFGWSNAMYTSTGASAKDYGAAQPAASIRADPTSKTITFLYDRRSYGIADWTGVKVYVTTWDFDGVDNFFRPLYPQATQYRMGGGTTSCYEPDGTTVKKTGCEDPLIMDEVPPFTLP